MRLNHSFPTVTVLAVGSIMALACGESDGPSSPTGPKTLPVGAIEITATTTGVESVGPAYSVQFYLSGSLTYVNGSVSPDGNARFPGLMPGDYTVTLYK